MFAVHSKKVDAIPNVKTLPELGATSKFFTVSGFSGWAVPKATPQPIVDRLSELCVAANNDPKVKEILATFVLEPAIGFKESNALYQRELPVWIEAGTGARLAAGLNWPKPSCRNQRDIRHRWPAFIGVSQRPEVSMSSTEGRRGET